MNSVIPWLQRGGFKEMTKLNSSREYFIKKRKEALAKINSFREDFRKKEKEMKADLEETRKIWRGLSERFKWWGSLP
jgi:hypothetical protein